MSRRGEGLADRQGWWWRVPARPALLVMVALGLTPGVALAEEALPPTIVVVALPPRLVAQTPLDFVVVYRAPKANVVAIDQTVEDLDGPLLQRTTRQRRIGVVAQAFGYREGELRAPVAFPGAGRRRLTFVLVTDDGEESEPRAVEVEIAPRSPGVPPVPGSPQSP